MITPTTIVVAVDFSAHSRAAIGLASDVAERTGAALHLVHADVLFRSGTAEAPDTVPSSSLRIQLERFSTHALGHDPKATVAIVRAVSVAPAVLEYAETVGADLLVVGTHGRSAVGRLVLGSVAEACIASAHCPVLAVPLSAQLIHPSPESPVLVAVDFSTRSRAALVAAHALAGAFQADVELVHVVRDAGPYPGFGPQILSLVDYDPAQEEVLRKRLLRFAEIVGGPAPTACHVAIGAPSRALVGIAADRHAGAIVMGTHGRTGPVRLLGSVAAATLRRASCPVLTLKEVERWDQPVLVVSALA